MDTNPIIIALSTLHGGIIQPLFHLTLMLSAATGLLAYIVKPLRRVIVRALRNPRVFLPLAGILGSGFSIEILLGYFTS